MATNVSKESTVTFVDAFTEKYSHLIDDNVVKPQVVPQKAGADRVVQFVGVEKVADKISRHLKEVSLGGQNIRDLGSMTDQIKDKLKNVTSLDLSNNSFTNWFQVLEIVKHCPSLTQLIISKNVNLTFPSDIPFKEVSEFKKSFEKVTWVVFGSSEQTWFGVTYCGLQVWSHNVQILDLFNNGIDELHVPPQNLFLNLTALSLTKNPIRQWSEICKLGHLPKLQMLNVSECSISSIKFEEAKKTLLFPKLKELNVSRNHLESWKDIAELNKLDELEILNVRYNPVTAVDQAEDYATIVNLVLARVSGLKKVNHEDIHKNVHEEAAKFYVNKHYPEYLERTKDGQLLDDEWHAHHPRWHELLDYVGKPAQEHARPKYIELVFQKEDDGQKLTKKIPLSTKVSIVSQMVKRMFSIQDEDITLHYRINKHEEEFEYPLEEDEHPISFYDMDNNDVIVVKQSNSNSSEKVNE